MIVTAHTAGPLGYLHSRDQQRQQSNQQNQRKTLKKKNTQKPFKKPSRNLGGGRGNRKEKQCSTSAER